MFFLYILLIFSTYACYESIIYKTMKKLAHANQFHNALKSNIKALDVVGGSSQNGIRQSQCQEKG